VGAWAQVSEAMVLSTNIVQRIRMSDHKMRVLFLPHAFHFHALF
jgi:hypothetical protein